MADLDHALYCRVLLLVIQFVSNFGHALCVGHTVSCTLCVWLCVRVVLSVVHFMSNFVAGLIVSCTVWIWLWPCLVCRSYRQLFSLCLTLTMPCVWVLLSVVQFVSNFDHALCAGLTLSCSVCVWLWSCLVCGSYSQLYSLCLTLTILCVRSQWWVILCTNLLEPCLECLGMFNSLLL